MHYQWLLFISVRPSRTFTQCYKNILSILLHFPVSSGSGMHWGNPKISHLPPLLLNDLQYQPNEIWRDNDNAVVIQERNSHIPTRIFFIRFGKSGVLDISRGYFSVSHMGKVISAIVRSFPSSPICCSRNKRIDIHEHVGSRSHAITEDRQRGLQERKGRIRNFLEYFILGTAASPTLIPILLIKSKSRRKK